MDANLKVLALNLLGAIMKSQNNGWDQALLIAPAEEALLTEMLKTPEKAVVIAGQVIAVIFDSKGSHLGVWDL